MMEQESREEESKEKEKKMRCNRVAEDMLSGIETE